MGTGSCAGRAERLALTVLIHAAIAIPSGVVGAEPRDGCSSRQTQQLLRRGEALLSIGREADGLQLLRRALARSRPRGAGERGWCARYIRFRLARHHHGEGHRARAEAELVRALRIPAKLEGVAPAYRVTRDHPFIVEHYPRVAGLSRERHPLHRVIPAARQVVGRGPRVYAVSRRAVQRLDRRQLSLMTIHRLPLAAARPDDEIVAFAPSADGRRVVVAQRLAGRLELRFIDFDPLTERAVTAPGRPTHLTLDRQGRALLVTRGRRGRLRLYRVAPPAKAAVEGPGARLRRRPALRPGHVAAGAALALLPEGLLYVDRGGRRRPRQVILRELDTRRSRVLFAFGRRDPRNAVRALVSPSGARLALLIDEAARSRVVVVDLRSHRRYGHVQGGQRGLTLARLPPAGRPPVAFSDDEQSLVLAAGGRGGERLELRRFDYRKGFATRLATVEGSGELRGLGDTGRLAWLHRGNHLLLVAPGGKPRTVDLAPLVKLRGFRWRGWTRYLPAPGQWLLGLRGPGTTEASPGPYALLPAAKLR